MVFYCEACPVGCYAQACATLLRAVGAEDAAIPGLGTQQSCAVNTFMEEAAAILGHLFKRFVSTLRASDRGEGACFRGGRCRRDWMRMV